jgi:hypothetical protein
MKGRSRRCAGYLSQEMLASEGETQAFRVREVHEREELVCNIPDRMWARPINGGKEKGKCKPG